MKFFLYAILLMVEYCLGKIVYLLWVSMVSSGLAVVPGIILCLFFVVVMITIWRHGSRMIRGE